MYKLVILIEFDEDKKSWDDSWPDFLHHAEQMPGLLKESTSRIESVLYGTYRCSLIHELHFNSKKSLQNAMSSTPGRTAGEILQKITGGKMTLLLANHQEDNLANIRKFKSKRETNDR